MWKPRGVIAAIRLCHSLLNRLLPTRTEDPAAYGTSLDQSRLPLLFLARIWFFTWKRRSSIRMRCVAIRLHAVPSVSGNLSARFSKTLAIQGHRGNMTSLGADDRVGAADCRKPETNCITGRCCGFRQPHDGITSLKAQRDRLQRSRPHYILADESTSVEKRLSPNLSEKASKVSVCARDRSTMRRGNWLPLSKPRLTGSWTSLTAGGLVPSITPQRAVQGRQGLQLAAAGFRHWAFSVNFQRAASAGFVLKQTS